MTHEVVFSLSKRHENVNITLVMSAELNPIDRYSAIGIRVQPEITAAVPVPVFETILVRAIPEAVIRASKPFRAELIDDRDLEVSISQFRLSVPYEELTKKERRKLAQETEKVVAECTGQLLGRIKA